jgi:hypothetical protein
MKKNLLKFLSVFFALVFIFNISAGFLYAKNIKRKAVVETSLEDGYKPVNASFQADKTLKLKYASPQSGETGRVKENVEAVKIPSQGDNQVAKKSIFNSISNFIKKVLGLFQNKDRTKNQDYKNTVDFLAQESGIDRGAIEKAFAELDDKQFYNAISVLSEMSKNGGHILSCGLYSLSAVLGISEKEAAFVGLMADIKIGAFSKQSLDAQYTYGITAEASMEVLRAYGQSDAALYEMEFNDFMNLLGDGESAILMIGLHSPQGEKIGDHIIAVTKTFNKDTREFEYTVSDNDKISVYTQEGFTRAMSGGQRIDKDGAYAYKGDEVRYSQKGEFITGSSALAKAKINGRKMIPKENREIQKFIKNIIANINKSGVAPVPKENLLKPGAISPIR